MNFSVEEKSATLAADAHILWDSLFPADTGNANSKARGNMLYLWKFNTRWSLFFPNILHLSRISSMHWRLKGELE